MSRPEIFTFNTLEDVARAARRMPHKWQNCGHDSNGLSYNECVETMLRGDDSQVPSARKLLDRLMTDSLEVSEPRWVREVAGAFPSVPDFLANDPESMFTLYPVECETAPITIWVDLASSCGVSLEELENRGIATLALVMKLQQTRPVMLNVCYGAPDNGVGLIMPWNTRPLELATSCAMLCRGELTRLPLMAIMRKASQSYIGKLLRTEKETREFFQIPENDLVLNSTIIWNSVARTNPLQWVNEQLKKAGAAVEEEVE